MPDSLATRVRAKFPGQYDDLADADLEAKVIAKHPEYRDLATPQKTEQPGMLSQAWDGAKDLASRGLNFVKQHPAETGAMVGGMAAVPLTGGASLLPAMAAAGLGGAGGAGLGMIAGAVGGSPNIPTTSGGVLRTMGEQGALQAGAEAGGRAVQGVLRSGAGRLYQSVLKPTLAARIENPNLVKTALQNAIPVSAGGVDKAGQLIGDSMGKADALVQDAASLPNTGIDPRRAVGGITQAVKDVRGLPVARPQMQAIGDYGRQYLAEHPGPLSLPDAQASVRATDKFYNPAYRATMDRGNPITSGQTAAALGINNETRGLLRDAVPGLKGQNAVTQGLAGVRDAVERRTGQLGNNSVMGMQHAINAGVGGLVGTTEGGKSGLGTFAAMEALTNPAIASRLAIGAFKGASFPMSQAMRAALLAQLAGGDQ